MNDINVQTLEKVETLKGALENELGAVVIDRPGTIDTDVYACPEQVLVLDQPTPTSDIVTRLRQIKPDEAKLWASIFKEFVEQVPDPKTVTDWRVVALQDKDGATPVALVEINIKGKGLMLLPVSPSNCEKAGVPLSTTWLAGLDAEAIRSLDDHFAVPELVLSYYKGLSKGARL